MSCVEYENSIERLLADEIGDEERLRLLAHGEGCARCAELVELHGRLLDRDLEPELPNADQFAAMRAAVLGELALSGEPRTSDERRGLVELFRGWIFRPAFSAALAALAVVALGLGFAVGRQVGDRPVQLGGMLASLNEEARSNRILADVEDSPYVYSNVAFRDARDGGVELSFDVTRHIEVMRQADDPLVKEVLVQSLLNPSSVGTRLAAISHTGGMIDPKVKQALIVTVFNDASQVVRLRALENLARHKDDPEIRSALIAVLEGEESVQMRLVALDNLATSGLGAERFDHLIEDLTRPEDRALQIRAASYRPVVARPLGR